MRSTSYDLSNLWDGIQNGAAWDAGVVFKRIAALPIDKYAVVSSYNAARDYAQNNAVAYPGQIITVVDDATSAVSIYKIKVDGELKQIDDVDISTLTSSISSISSTLTTDISSISSVLTDEIQFVSSDTSSKIWIEDRISGTISSHSNLSVVKLSEDEYIALYPEYKPNMLYVVESDNLNAYDGKIVNVADGEEDSDAVNYGQLASVESNLTSVISGVSSLLTSNISSVSSNLTTTISSISSTLTTDISSISSVLTDEIQFVSSDTSSKIWIEDRISNLISGHSNLSVVKLTEEEYANLYPNYDPNSLYVVESNNLNAYDARVINVADGVENYDVVNVKQLKSLGSALTSGISAVSSVLTTDISAVSSVLTTDISAVSSVLTTDISAISSVLTDEIWVVSSDTSSKIWIEDRISNLISGHSNLSVIKLSEDEYAALYPNYEPNTIYVVEPDNLNAYDARVVNVADGSENHDAINVKQLKSLSSVLATNISSVSVNLECGVQLCVGTDASVFADGKNNGDVAVLSTEIGDSGKYQVTGYVWKKDISAWSAMDGNYNAKTVIFDDDISLNGLYTTVGNIQRSSGTLGCKNKSLFDVFKDIFDTTIMPELCANPSISITKYIKKPGNNNVTDYEVGEMVSVSYSINYTQGTYISSWAATKTGPDGTSPSSYAVITNISSGIQTGNSGVYGPFIPTEGTQYYISANVGYSEGGKAQNNKGETVDVQRPAGSCKTSTNLAKPKRKMFYYVGNETDTSNISSSEFIRSAAVGHGFDWATPQNLSARDLVIPNETNLVMYALPGSCNLLSVGDVAGLGLDVAANFHSQTVTVEGASTGYSTTYTCFWTYNMLGLKSTTYQFAFSS